MTPQGQYTASCEGVVEVISSSPSKVTLRIRATVSEDQKAVTTGFVEGQIDVHTCGG